MSQTTKASASITSRVPSTTDRSSDNDSITATIILESPGASLPTASDAIVPESSSAPIPTFGPAVEASQVGQVRDGIFQPARAFSYYRPTRLNVGDIEYLDQLRRYGVKRYGEVLDEASVPPLSESPLSEVAPTAEPAPVPTPSTSSVSTEYSAPVEIPVDNAAFTEAALGEAAPTQTVPTEILVPPELRVPVEATAAEAIPVEATSAEAISAKPVSIKPVSIKPVPSEYLVPIESRVPAAVPVPEVSAPTEAFASREIFASREAFASEAFATESYASTEELDPPDIAPQILTGPRPLYFLSVSYHSSAFLSDLLHTLDANQGGVTGVVVVNNSPNDRSVNTLCDQTYADAPVTVLDAPINMGFGAGCNVGLRWIYERSPHALVWIIHPDAKLLPNAVASIRQCCSSRPDIAILGTPILDSNGGIWFGSGRFNRLTGNVDSSQKVASDILRRPTPARWVSDYSMVLNLAALGHCPQFDEVYFLNYEDCDLCERYFQQGQVISMAPLPVVVHNSAGTSGRYTKPKFVYSTVGKLTFLRHHSSTMSLLLNVAIVLAQVAFGFGDRAKAYGRWQGLKLFFKAPVTPPLYTPAFEFD